MNLAGAENLVTLLRLYGLTEEVGQTATEVTPLRGSSQLTAWDLCVMLPIPALIHRAESCSRDFGCVGGDPMR